MEGYLGGNSNKEMRWKKSFEWNCKVDFWVRIEEKEISDIRSMWNEK